MLVSLIVLAAFLFNLRRLDLEGRMGKGPTIDGTYLVWTAGTRWSEEWRDKSQFPAFPGTAGGATETDTLWSISLPKSVGEASEADKDTIKISHRELTFPVLGTLIARTRFELHHGAETLVAFGPSGQVYMVIVATAGPLLLWTAMLPLLLLENRRKRSIHSRDS